MTDLFSIVDKPQPHGGHGRNLPEFTVSELSTGIKKTLEDAYGRVRVRGEICQAKLHSSGHLYFSLKDADAVIDAVAWRGSVARFAFRPAEGMDVVITGRITTYGKSSKYQLVAEEVALAGQGALLQLLEARRQQLAAEGLFDRSRKQPLPYLPQRIAVITSPTGAVIRDILHRLEDRFPLPVLLWPVAVQGETAAMQIASAIGGVNALSASGAIPKVDLIIVARGGGSLEDLMAFNEEIVVRAAAASAIPLISAVGHETDTTLIDHAADVRAPTPTAAAELAVPVRRDLLAHLGEQQRRLSQMLTQLGAHNELRLSAAARALGTPQRMLEPKAQRLDDLSERLSRAARHRLEAQRQGLAALSPRILHPQAQARLAAERLGSMRARLSIALTTLASRHSQSLLALGNRLPQPEAQIGLAQERLDAIAARLPLGLQAITERRAAKLNQLAALLSGHSVQKLLARGFALVKRDGVAITAAQDLRAGDGVEIVFGDGSRKATIGG